MADNSVQLELRLATEAAELALKKFQEQTKKASNTFDVFKGTLSANVALDALKTGFSAISNVFNSMISEAANAEASVKRMEVALSQAGLAGAGNSQYFLQLADALEQTTIYSGDAAESAIALFASLNNLSREGIGTALQVSSDLASTLGIDLAQASEMVSKAINGQTTSFNKLGISIQKGTTDSETLANITAALAGHQGAAQRSAETYTGAMTKMENQKGKLLESFGKLITQNTLVVSSMNTMTEVFASTASWIEANKENITLFAESLAIATGIVATAGAAWLAYGVIIGTTTVSFTALSTAATIAWAAITGPIGLAVIGITALGAAIFTVIKYWDNIKAATLEATAAVIEYAAKAASVFSSDIADKLNSEAQALRDQASATRELIAEKEKAAQINPEDQTTSVNSKQEIEELKRKNAEKLLLQREYNSNVYLDNQNLNLSLQELEQGHLDAMKSLKDGFTLIDLQKQLENEKSLLLAKQEYEAQALKATQDTQLAKIQLIENSVEREKALQEFNLKSQLENQKLANKNTLDLAKQRFKAEEQLNQKRLGDQKSTFSTIATLSNSSNKELAAIGKAAAITQIAIETPVAVSKAMSAFPPPYNFVAAGLVSAAMAAQAAEVAGVKFENGGIVGGSSFKGDRITAGVNSREMVLNMEQQKQLFKMANGQSANNVGSSESTNALLVELIGAVKSGNTIEINGKEVFNVVKSELNSGRTL